MSGPISVEFDGKFTVSYTVGDQASAFRVLPTMGRLIAAAPAMLAALKVLAEHDDWDKIPPAEMVMIEEAISKAEGAS